MGGPRSRARRYNSGILSPDSPDFPDREPAPGSPRTKALDPWLLLSAAATFLVLSVASEGASRLAARTGFWYRRLDLAGTVTSLPELEERIRWAAAQPRPAFLLGDSVLGASALLEHGTKESEARRETLAACLRRREARAGRHVESLAADGMLVPDLEAVGRLARHAPPQKALLLLNVRMFAREFQDPKKSVSREFFGGLLPPGVVARSGSSIEKSVPEWAVEHSSLLRASAMLKSLWYFPTRRDFFRRAAERVLGPDGDPELQEAALRLKVGGYYRDLWDAASPGFRSLERTLRDLSERTSAVVVLTPQNPDFVEDPALLRRNGATLEAFVRSRGLPRVRYRDWSERFPSDRFLDHCHLTAAGNREYAEDLAGLIEE